MFLDVFRDDFGEYHLDSRKYANTPSGVAHKTDVLLRNHNDHSFLPLIRKDLPFPEFTTGSSNSGESARTAQISSSSL